MWLDDYDMDYGVYKVFRDRDKCLDYLAETVFERAHVLDVRVRNIDDACLRCDGRRSWVEYPLLTRKGVRRIFDTNGKFRLGIRFNEKYGHVIDTVTMAVMEVEME